MVDKDYPVEFFATQEDWEKWLVKNYNLQPGVWLKFAKKASGILSINHDLALEVALCYGWIDGQAKSLDEKYHLQKFTPRGKRSTWSKRNCEIAERLIKEKKMQPAGFLQIEAAKKDGRWEQAYDSPKNMIIPEDFLKELVKNKKAEEFFQTLNKTNKFFIGFQLQTVKKLETRQRRIQKILAMLEKKEKFY